MTKIKKENFVNVESTTVSNQGILKLEEDKLVQQEIIHDSKYIAEWLACYIGYYLDKEEIKYYRKNNIIFINKSSEAEVINIRKNKIKITYQFAYETNCWELAKRYINLIQNEKFKKYKTYEEIKYIAYIIINNYIKKVKTVAQSCKIFQSEETVIEYEFTFDTYEDQCKERSEKTGKPVKDKYKLVKALVNDFRQISKQMEKRNKINFAKNIRSSNQNIKRPENISSIVRNIKTQTVITCGKYVYALTQIPNKTAYVAYLNNNDTIKYDKNNRAYIDNQLLDYDSIQKHIDLCILEKDLEPLFTIYTIINRLWQNDKKIISEPKIQIFMPDFLSAMGEKPNREFEKVLEIKNMIDNYRNLVGIIDGNKIIAVLNFVGYNLETRVLSLYSPYINEINKSMDKKSIIMKKKKPKEINGKIQHKPITTDLILSTLYNEKDKAACRNVRILVPLIETAGPNSEPHINAQTLYDRNHDLQNKISKCTSNNAKQNALRKTMINTWKYMDKDTLVKYKYKNLKLPTNAQPHLSNLSRTTFSITHNGVNKNWKKLIQKTLEQREKNKRKTNAQK